MIQPVFDRGVRDAVTNLLRLRDRPLLVRIVSPQISETEFPDRESLTRKIRNLRVQREATVSLIINPDRPIRMDQFQTLKKLEDLGVRLHFKHRLHSKLVVAHSRNEKCALVSSANLTDTGMNRQNEAGVFMVNDIPTIERIFEYSTRLLDESDKRMSLQNLIISPTAEEGPHTGGRR